MKNEIIIYNPSEEIKLEVRLENETVWLTQAQMAKLFKTTPQNITMHIKNIYKEGELELSSTCKDFLQVQMEGSRNINRWQKGYCLDVIISVGYRVKSLQGTLFRQWANKVLKEYLLKGYSINQRVERLEQRVTETENKIDFFVRTSLPPVEGVFYEGQIFDAYLFASDLIKSAKKSIVLMDNYIDETVLSLLDKRNTDVDAVIFTKNISPQLSLDLAKHNSQYKPIEIKERQGFHDRFLIIDDDVYHLGASLKDLGKKLFAFSKMELDKDALTKELHS